MPKPKEIQYEFWVCYKMAPHYTGNFRVNELVKPGIHGKFDTLKEAQAAEQKCKEFFTQEKVLQRLPDEKGKVKESIKTTVHDNVVTWIDEYRDDGKGLVYVEPEEKETKKKEKAA